MRICSPRSTSPRRRELSSLGGNEPDAGPHAMGRGSAERLGFEKGVSLGPLEPSSKAGDERLMKAKAGATLKVDPGRWQRMRRSR